MFIKEFWHYRKSGTIILLLFISAWCYLNYKQGAVATPLLQYGMYSGRCYVSDTQYVLRLVVNNKLLDFTKYSMSQRDQLQFYLEKFLVEKELNEKVFFTMRQLFSKAGLAQWMQKEKYINLANCQEFGQWYKKKVAAITREKIIELAAYRQKYIWQNDILTPVGTPLKITCIATN